MTIMVAEDDADDQMMIVRALKKHGIYHVHTAWDGEELLESLRQSTAVIAESASSHPVFILLDLNMPRKSGREALREIKLDPTLRQIPVVVLTTSASETDILESYDVGANAYITKPVKYTELEEAMGALIHFWLNLATLPGHVGTRSENLSA